MTLPSWPADRPLRAWQQEAAAAVFAHDRDAFLASATPAAGKTTFGLHIAHRMLGEGRVARVAVVAPTTHIARQWAADAARYGIDLEPNRPNADGPEPRDRDGLAVTYQTVAAGPGVHARRTAQVPTLLIADEPHHMGDQAAWGTNTVQAFGARPLQAAPLRHAVPHGRQCRSRGSRYDADGVSEPDYAYGYTDALLDRVCRPVTFHLNDGDMEWMSDGRRRSADFGVILPAAEAARRLRTALEPDGDWMAHVLRDAVLRLERVRAGDHPDAGGLVIAADKEHADALAERLERAAGERPEVVTSDAPDASARIARFAAGHGHLARLRADGLRGRRHPAPARRRLRHERTHGAVLPPGRRPLHPPHAEPADQMSHVYLPADPALKRLAVQVEEERKHALTLEPKGEPVEEQPERLRSEPAEAFRALWSSAHGEAEMLSTTQPGETMSLFAADPPPSPALAAFTASSATTVVTAAPSRPVEETAHEQRERLRDERRALVSALSRLTGESHKVIHARVNRDTGAASVTAASAAQLEKGNALLEREAARRR